jgi:hypothetical protein
MTRDNAVTLTVTTLYGVIVVYLGDGGWDEPLPNFHSRLVWFIQ